jgi:hypothetical protein
MVDIEGFGVVGRPDVVDFWVGLKPLVDAGSVPSAKADGNRRCEREPSELARSAELRGGIQAERSNELSDFFSGCRLKPSEFAWASAE